MKNMLFKMLAKLELALLPFMLKKPERVLVPVRRK